MSAHEHGAAGAADALAIRAWRPDEPAALEAFACAPGACDPLFHPRSSAEWDWAFRKNPGGTRLMLARRAGRIVAAFGALPVRTRAFGEPRVFSNQFGASLASGEPGSLLSACGAAFIAAHGGPGDDMLHYGWPEARERELWKTELGHELLCASALLVRPLGTGPARAGSGAEELACFGPEVEALYEACAAQWGASTVRDAAFLSWRFVANPRFRYRLFAVRGAAGLRGIGAYRAGSELRPRLGLMMDWLVLPGDEEAADGLLAAAESCARSDGSVALAAGLPEWSPWSLALQERGFLHSPSERLLFVRGSLPRFDMLYLRDHWWTTLADALFL